MPTLYEKLITAGLPIISATEEGEIESLQMTAEQQLLFSDILMEHFQPIQYADILTIRADRQQLKEEYQSTIATLQTIESTTSPTNAQVIAAVKFLAKTLRLLLKLLARLIP